MLRKTLFWAHLCCGVLAGLVILMMSATGVVLTYERQIAAWADRLEFGAIEGYGPRQTIESLLASARLQGPEFTPTSVIISSDPNEAVELGGERGAGSRYMHPYTGRLLGDGSARAASFFAAVRGWHRWFDAGPEDRAPWRTITGASNLLFLFLLISGLYLWLPQVSRWALFRARLLLRTEPSSSHARDYNWHHVFGIWSVLPLIIVVATAVVFSYGWAGDLVYRAFGEASPVRGTRQTPTAPTPESARGGLQGRGDSIVASTAAGPARSAIAARHLPLDELIEIAVSRVDRWESITLELPEPNDTNVSFTIHESQQRQFRHNLKLNAVTGAVTEWSPFDSQSPGQQARRWVRYLHTGEAFGLAGQTLAGIVSLTSLIMVWTGFALAYRRLLAPVLKPHI